MRRIVAVFFVLMCLLCIAIPAQAVTGASSVTGFASVASDGGCQISLTVQLHLEQALDELYFPIPAAATGVSLNGARVRAAKSGNVRRINLTRLARNVVGDVTANIQYSLYDVIHTTAAGTLEMQLPLLSGFDYPVQSMEFSVTMPGEVDVLPGFISGYHQARIEESLTYTVNGAVISGSTVKALKDHETLTMTMAVKETMFPRSLAQTRDYGKVELAMAACAILALLYWLIAMWNPPGLARTQTQPPQGCHAGELGCVLALRGIDLTMMILSWAQLGYVLIHIKGQRVLLYKQMEMGNERSDAEVRYFHKLFAKGDCVDTKQLRYAQLCRLAAQKPEGLKELLRRFNGDPRVFRVIASGIGLFGGVSIAVAMADGAALQGLMMVLFGALGALSGWYLQQIGAGIFLRDRRILNNSITISCIWLVLGLISGAAEVGLLMIIGLALAGVLLAWGGRRTHMGRLTQMQTIGFARYLRSVSKAQIGRIFSNDPDYFFRLAPYALALGLEKSFAKRFDQLRLDRCPYLTTGMDGHMTALQWSALMRRAVDSMNDRAQKLPLEKVICLIRNIIRG